MKLVEVTNSNNIFKIIGTLRDPRINMDVLKTQTENFISELESYREDLIINSPELKVCDLLDENFIMSGKFPPILVEAMSKVGGTSYTLDTFIKLGFTTTENASFRDLNGFMYNGYNALRNVILKAYLGAQKEIAECPDTEVFLPMFREGIKVASKSFITFAKYCAVKSIQPEMDGDMVSESFHNSHIERYNEWVETEVEKVLLSLFETPTIPAFVAPIGIGSFLEDLKAIQPALYDAITEYGEVPEPSIADVRKPKFAEEIKKLTVDQREAVAAAIQSYNEKNISGKMMVNGGEVPVPSAVSIIDATIGFMLYAGDMIVNMAPIVAEGTVNELMDTIEDESIKSYIDLIVEELTEYGNPLEIAVNLASIPSKLIPMYIFENVIFRLNQVPELNELNANIYGIFFAGIDNEEE